MSEYLLGIAIVAGFVAMWAHGEVTGYEETLAGQAAVTFSSEHQSQYQMYWWIRTIAAGAAVLFGLGWLGEVEAAEE
ncbi:hypothetical protein [Natronosalvus caseinilyticus]|uniref:hypothetical protein n=1 Tax=Natronosalvus caseinilyticus TaxID=2953747 RepID=UPI0028ABBA2A|nr:hypothetical protein [Natronosalvus caseinilyticus]